MSSLYDHPKWYDTVYGSDWRAEFDFLSDCCELFLQDQVESIYEPACGTGRLLYRLAQHGFQVEGIDLNSRAVDYCNRRFAKYGLPETARVADMCQYVTSRPVDLAFNFVSSFRHVIGLEPSRDHLNCVARSLKVGGMYALGFHLSPTQGEPSESEAWSARRGKLEIKTSMNLIERSWQDRIERFEIGYEVSTPKGHAQFSDTIEFQMYTLEDFLDLLKTDGNFAIEAAYDFHYQIESPIELSDESEDVVFILRKLFR